MFGDCSSLTSVNFPVCTSIGQEAFRCTSLTSVNFPACTEIGESAFYSCTSLTSVNFPECMYIGSFAFLGCSSLTSVSFPACTDIGIAAFAGCSSLSRLYLTASSVVTLGFSVFDATPIRNSSYLGYYGSIYVPAELISSYQTASNWSYYSDRFAAIE